MGLMGMVVGADLIGNWSWTVWLLIPVVLVLAVVTAIVVGPGAEPERTQRGTGGVSRYLERRAAGEPTDHP